MTTAKKVFLMITTSARQMGEAGKPTGVWAEELAVPYYELIDAGIHVDIASPTGGAIPFDPGSIKPAGSNDPTVERLLTDSVAQAKVKTTHRIDALDAGRYDAVFFPGGHGTMWDLPGDGGVKLAVESAFAAGKVIASVCHGAAGLVSARRPDGEAVIKGIRINAFTDAEETAAGLVDVVPFKLESRLRELGAQFESAANWQSFAVQDGQFITGQNPQSSRLVARHLLAAIDASTNAATADVA